MTIRELLSVTATQLQPHRITCAADRDLGRLEAEVLLAHVLKKDRAWLLAHDMNEVPRRGGFKTRPYVLFNRLVKRRLKHEPIAYIQGEKEFYGLPFLVNRHTLIPRPESEQVVELACAAIKRKPTKRARHAAPLLWDIGTGSGAIAVAIAKQIPGCHVLATDLSSASLAMAKKNARRNSVSNIKFLNADLLDASARRVLSRHSSFTIRHSPLTITANLPYLPASDKKTMDRDVVGYEPSSALFSGPDGLTLIEKLLRQLAAFDIHFDTLLLEHDPRQTKKLHAMATKLLPNVTIQTHKDLAGRDRVTEITRP